MAFYYTIDNRKEAGRRTAKGLVRLKSAIREQIPRRTVTDTLLLATWNIREFDSASYGRRTKEGFFYIAEIISSFDLVAVQEVREDVSALERVNRILGHDWDYLLTDVTEGVHGNRERMAFLYDTKKVRFGGLAGEVVIPPVRTEDYTYRPAEQLARTPFLVGFQVGWFKFMLCTVHILYGSRDPEDPERVQEIEMISEFLADKAEDEHSWADNLILLGDFNIFDTTDTTLEAITSAGFVVPEQLQSLPSNAVQTKHYDQIAFRSPRMEQQLAEARAGVFDFFEVVMRDDQEEVYIDAMGDAYETTSEGDPRSEEQKHRYYRRWRTYQLSDHLPMWIELKIDFGEEYLQAKTEPPE